MARQENYDHISDPFSSNNAIPMQNPFASDHAIQPVSQDSLANYNKSEFGSGGHHGALPYHDQYDGGIQRDQPKTKKTKWILCMLLQLPGSLVFHRDVAILILTYRVYCCPFNCSCSSFNSTWDFGFC